MWGEYRAFVNYSGDFIWERFPPTNPPRAFTLNFFAGFNGLTSWSQVAQSWTKPRVMVRWDEMRWGEAWELWMLTLPFPHGTLRRVRWWEVAGNESEREHVTRLNTMRVCELGGDLISRLSKAPPPIATKLFNVLPWELLLLGLVGFCWGGARVLQRSRVIWRILLNGFCRGGAVFRWRASRVHTLHRETNPMLIKSVEMGARTISACHWKVAQENGALNMIFHVVWHWMSLW